MLRSGASATVVALAILACFALGTATGASIAQNESASVADATGELEQLPGEARADITDGSDGIHERMVASMAVPVVKAATAASIAGVRLGHQAPVLGKLVPGVVNVLMISGLGYYCYSTYRRIQRLR